ncbi:TBC1 domain family member 19 [Armadillidium nasatum]|uniref:TBC1 domain family member 19 n=1 Tax=Armadillidium nasatum TaxID=96803 RepID=A0A5N5SVB8_9CRUS|nr:TBC1 domain family member 19 [Armadillidium nasatum]
MYYMFVSLFVLNVISSIPDLSEIRPVYAAKDFLEVLSSLRNPNYDENIEETLWGVIKLPLKTRDIRGLVEYYGEIAACLKHIGLDDAVPGEYKPTLSLSSERLLLGRKVLERNHGPMSKELCKQGCPPSLRSGIWHQILGLEIGDKEKEYFENLKNLVFEHDLLVDRLIKKDIQLTCSNDDHYFVFEDVLHQVLLCFFRDTEILRRFENSSGSPSLAVCRGSPLHPETLVAFPPCGIIPFHGFTMYEGII